MATPTDGSNVQAEHYCGINIINKIKNNFAGAAAPASPTTGCSWYDSTNDILKIYNSTSWQEAALVHGVAPPGAIVAWCPGYFTDGSNGGYTNVQGAGNTVAQQNTFLNGDGWYICDGAAVNNASSPIWNAASRYLPNLTDDRFIMGDTVCASDGGGSNTMAHTHQCDPGSTATGGPSATSTVAYLSASWYAATGTHTHNVDVAEFTSGVASDTDNKPVYLSLYFAIRVF